MNTENMLKLADVIEKQEHVLETDYSGFNMAKYWHPCGTPSCIAGFASNEAGFTKRNALTFSRARKWLGIGDAIAERLFAPSERQLGFPMLNITPAMAAWTLRNLAETGEVVWRQP